MSKYHQHSETHRKRILTERMVLVHAALLLCALIVVARLLELQVIRGSEYHALAQSQHFGGVVLPAKRGEILSRNSKTGDTSILATNTTLDMVYVDPFVTDNPSAVASTLTDLLVTEEAYNLCKSGSRDCPIELATYFSAAFDPLERIQNLTSGALLEPLASGLPPVDESKLPDFQTVKSQFSADVQEKISEKRVTFAPLVYGATKVQLQAVEELGIPGIEAVRETKLIYANPEVVAQGQLPSIARRLADPLEMDPTIIQDLLRSRPLRYVPVMRKLTPELSIKIKEMQLESLQKTNAERAAATTRQAADAVRDPMRSIALIPEHWRYYPDATVGSHVVGFLNASQEAQYGIERTFDPQLRGQEGLISTVSDPQGGQILTSNQTIINPRDGDTIVLTIDRFIQKEVEKIMDEAVKTYDAESGQAIVMEPQTGRITAMVNAPIFNSNQFGNVYQKDVIYIPPEKQKEIVAEIYNPTTNIFVVRAFYDEIFAPQGRTTLSEEVQKELEDIEALYDLEDIARYYLYIGENNRREIFPTERKEFWLKFENNIGVGAYLNRTIQEIYEPGSVMKPITMAVAIDQGEVQPEDMYDDFEPVKVDEFTIRNALNMHYGKVNMIQCIEKSINTCMTTVSGKLGRKLFHRMLERFGFGKITGIQLEDELPGELLPWRNWSNALLATASYGQGVSATPLQMITAFASLANGGKLMRPIILDSVIHADGTEDVTKPFVVDQIIRPETADTVTSMLVNAVEQGYGNRARIQGYKIAGKTGTSQIAGPGGKYETGTGSGIATFAGFAPVQAPEFIILVKLDRPKGVEFGADTAAPVFKRIADFLFDYYGIPPDQQR